MAEESIGPYRIVRLLGAGAVGTVYLAEGAQGPVALKVLHEHLLGGEGFFRRFLREARVGLRLEHPNLVRTLDCDLSVADERIRCYLVLEYVEGRTLADLLAEMGRIPEALLREIARQVASALTYLHAHDIVHRDLKPRNVLITRDERVKVMDFGLAWLPEDGPPVSQTGQFLGTVLYAAPEQFRRSGSELDGRTDLYALGMMLHELASGSHPFGGADVYEVIEHQMHTLPPPLGRVLPGISPFLEALVGDLLAKELAKRLPSASLLVEVLDGGESSRWWRRRTPTTRHARSPRRLHVPRDTGLHGRVRERAALGEAFDAACSGSGRTIVIEGEAGVGKSRLVDALIEGLRAEGREVTFLFGTYPPGGAATAHGPTLEAIREHYGMEGLERDLAEDLGAAPLLVPSFRALVRGEPPPRGDAPLGRDALHTMLGHLLRALAATRPVLFLLEDLHLAPEEGRAAFAALVPVVRDQRVLLVGTASPDLPAPWLAEIERHPHLSRLRLERLDPRELEDLLADALGSREVAQEIARPVEDRSDGNPHLVLEILRRLREEGALREAPDGVWRTTRRIEEVDLPDSAADFVRARLGAIDAEDRQVLEVAACAGYSFDPALVARASGLERIRVLRRLAEMERTVRLVRSDGRHFVFDHSRTHHFLYGDMPPLLREELHAALGETLRADLGESGEPEGETAATVCRHLLLGGRFDAGVPFLLPALDHLAGQSLSREALELADLALERPGLLKGPVRAEALIRRSELLHLRGETVAAAEAVEEAVLLAARTGDPGLHVRALHLSGTVAMSRGDSDGALARLRTATELATRARDAAGEARVVLTAADVHADRGDFEQSTLEFQRALAIAEGAGLERHRAAAIGNLGFNDHEQGREEEARERFELARELFRKVGDRRGEARATGALGLVLKGLGRFEESLEHHREHLRIAREIGDRRGESVAWGNAGACLVNLGRHAEAFEPLERDLQIARELDNPRGEATALVSLAVAHAQTGSLVQARELARHGREVAATLGHRLPEAMAWFGAVREDPWGMPGGSPPQRRSRTGTAAKGRRDAWMDPRRAVSGDRGRADGVWSHRATRGRTGPSDPDRPVRAVHRVQRVETPGHRGPDHALQWLGVVAGSDLGSPAGAA